MSLQSGLSSLAAAIHLHVTRKNRSKEKRLINHVFCGFYSQRAEVLDQTEAAPRRCIQWWGIASGGPVCSSVGC